MDRKQLCLVFLTSMFDVGDSPDKQAANHS